MENKNRIYLLLWLSLIVFSASLIVMQSWMFKADIFWLGGQEEQVEQVNSIQDDPVVEIEAGEETYSWDSQIAQGSLDYVEDWPDTADWSLDYIEDWPDTADWPLDYIEDWSEAEDWPLDYIEPEQPDDQDTSESEFEQVQQPETELVDTADQDLQEVEDNQQSDASISSWWLIDQTENDPSVGNEDFNDQDVEVDTISSWESESWSSWFTVVTEVVSSDDDNQSVNQVQNESSDIWTDNLFESDEQEGIEDLSVNNNQETQINTSVNNQVQQNNIDPERASEVLNQNNIPVEAKSVYISDQVKNWISKQLEKDFTEYLDLFLSWDLTTSDLDLDESNFSISWDDSLSHNVKIRLEKAKEEELRKNKVINEIEEEKKKLFAKYSDLQTQIYDIKEWKEVGANYKNIVNNKEEFKKIGWAIALNKDADLDWLPDYIENILDSNMLLIDTDWDWYSDYDEIMSLTNPNWKWDLYPDIYKNSWKAAIIKKAINHGLSFVIAWANFWADEVITRREAVKMISSALFSNEVISFNWDNSVFVYDDILWDEEFMKYYKVWQINNLFDGIIAYKFLPWGSFNRAEFIKLLINWIWEPLTQTRYEWKDTEMKNWFTPYLSTAKDFWIITVAGISRFRPYDKITRYEAIKLSLKALAYKKNNK